MYLFFNPLPSDGGSTASTPDRRCLLVGGGIVIPLPNELSIVRFLPPLWWPLLYPVDKLPWFTPPTVPPTKPDFVAKPSCLIRPAAHSRALDRALDSVLRLLILILLQSTQHTNNHTTTIHNTNYKTQYKTIYSHKIDRCNRQISPLPLPYVPSSSQHSTLNYARR